MLNFYFLFFWILSVLSYFLFFLQIYRLEKKYDLVIERYVGNKFPMIKELKRTLHDSSNRKIIKEIKMSLFCLYFSRVYFAVPVLIFLFMAMFS